MIALKSVPTNRTKTTENQSDIIRLIPPGKVTMIQKAGKTYYIFPDPVHNQAYVGGPKQYRRYQQLRTDNKLANENLESAEMYQMPRWSGVYGAAGARTWGPMGGPGPGL
jgi:hypothetical protein